VLALRKLTRFSLLASILTLAVAAPAWAQGKLDAHYTVSLAGLPIGKGTWLVDVTDTHYSATVTGMTTGLLHAFIGGEGAGTARGTLQGGALLSSLYAASIKTSKKTDAVRLTINNGNVKDYKIEPPQDDPGERVPVTEAHRHGVLDPMTASLVRMPGNGELMVPEACERTLSIFDGRLRYDLQLAYKRMDKVKADKGYSGPALVCSLRFTPVAGYIPSRAAIKYIVKLRDIEVWLAPIAGTRVLVPFRAQGPSPIGPVVMEATQFISVASPAKATGKESGKETSKPSAVGAQSQ
jgi:hypothetical protein